MKIEQAAQPHEQTSKHQIYEFNPHLRLLLSPVGENIQFGAMAVYIPNGEEAPSCVPVPTVTSYPDQHALTMNANSSGQIDIVTYQAGSTSGNVFVSGTEKGFVQSKLILYHASYPVSFAQNTIMAKASRIDGIQGRPDHFERHWHISYDDVDRSIDRRNFQGGFHTNFIGFNGQGIVVATTAEGSLAVLERPAFFNLQQDLVVEGRDEESIRRVLRLDRVLRGS